MITDIDGNKYDVIKIGDLYWTVENLKTTKFNDGTEIELITNNKDWIDVGENNIPAYCYYDNDLSNKHKYGALYNFHAVNTVNLAPEGWRVPTNEDWTNLENYLINNGYNWDGIAKSMAANTDWKTNNYYGSIGNDLSKNNKSCFSALPGGYRDIYGNFYNIGNNGYWWSATESDASKSYNRSLDYDLENLYWSYSSKGCGFSVRLVRDMDENNE
jgi:uncharacterized protein (TIGR02145 family)